MTVAGHIQKKQRCKRNEGANMSSERLPLLRLNRNNMSKSESRNRVPDPKELLGEIMPGSPHNRRRSARPPSMPSSHFQNSWHMKTASAKSFMDHPKIQIALVPILLDSKHHLKKRNTFIGLKQGVFRRKHAAGSEKNWDDCASMRVCTNIVR